MLNRRETLKLGAVGVAGLALPGVMGARSLRSALAASGVVPPAFSVPLAVPPVARPVRRSATTDYYEMTMRETEVEVLPGVKTKVLAYDGRFPGPTICTTRGRRVEVRQRNGLQHDAVVHLHGGLVPPSSDGHPKDAIMPGEQRVYKYPNHQPGATLWYHDHTHHMEAEHVFRGLAGFYLIKDPAERRLGLPSGRYDVPLMLRDARFDDTGQLFWEMDDFRYRNTILVNGRPQPYFAVDARKYRLRLLNASNERYFDVGLSDGADMTVIGADNGLLTAPLRAKSVKLSPGERVDVVVDFGAYAAGTSVVLINTERATDETKNVLRFDVGRRVDDDSRVPDELAPPLDLGVAEVERDVVMSFDLKTGQFLIDGKTFDMDRVDLTIKRGQTEVWRVHNRDTSPSIPHNIHLHGMRFQVLDRNGAPVTGHETGPKDTVAVPIGGDVRIKLRYDDYLGLYPYHCHLLDHSSMGMMAQAQIVD